MTLQARSCPTCHSIGPRRDDCQNLWHIEVREVVAAPLISADDPGSPQLPADDLADIRTKWLKFCSHDTGLPYPCICPDEDHRPVIAALVGEVETLRAEVERLTEELGRWTSGRRVKGLRTVESVPDGLHYAAELVRAQGTEGGLAHDDLLVAAGMRLKALDDASRQLLAEAVVLRAERDEARAELTALKGARLLSVVFGHHHGAPRPFVLYRRDGYAPRDHNRVALGAEFADGAVALRLVNDGGWTTISTGGAESFAGDDCLVIWLSDELEPLAAMETERDAMRPVVEALADLVALKDGPRGDEYDLRKPAAWQAARAALAAVDQMATPTAPRGDLGGDRDE
jgi:hypothetical protein